MNIIITDMSINKFYTHLSYHLHIEIDVYLCYRCHDILDHLKWLPQHTSYITAKFTKAYLTTKSTADFSIKSTSTTDWPNHINIGFTVFDKSMFPHLAKQLILCLSKPSSSWWTSPQSPKQTSTQIQQQTSLPPSPLQTVPTYINIKLNVWITQMINVNIRLNYQVRNRPHHQDQSKPHHQVNGRSHHKVRGRSQHQVCSKLQ